MTQAETKRGYKKRIPLVKKEKRVIRTLEERIGKWPDPDSVIETIEDISRWARDVNPAIIEILMRKNKIPGYLIARKVEEDQKATLPGKVDKYFPYYVEVIYNYSNLKSELKSQGIEYEENLERLQETGILQE